MLILHDWRLPEEYKTALARKLEGVNWFPMWCPSSVYGSISGHPDIYFFQLDAKTVIHAPCVPGAILQAIKNEGVTLIEGKKPPAGCYPETVRFNASRVGRHVFLNAEYADEALKEALQQAEVTVVPVAQGYARCSIITVSDTAMITSDKGIADAALERGIDALLIEPGNITLSGEKYGFIGGSGAIAPCGTVLFLGDIALHPDGSRIKAFLEKHGVNFACAEGLPLFDAGGLIIF